ncbi:Neutral alpha-glucosidase AB precursor, putative [Perkinsus marinus ATCC 50983]|uniref:Neutral alpha-glucosidase AB, putative n=1 Tax=Perkinsus marinus (strain ATCC 50983 / TXsc) TaxID=423536 RepID=C5KWL8_PERM5|nr:Neutral alpha-glucosidase AB precursor, putative [Perkinsus marinus ATCC 50983]EER11093.1 Neutral alpha-glucosidase AB precursor, putative [Perkinsus marinus ATCC 50983]|eukprot:XP_002779298.1 Neutral alpha-glucosidase AB precursor, putative [Perkinsus marinus ATCC 50983]
MRALLIALLPGVFAVDSSKFKTCTQSSFCDRYRAWTRLAEGTRKPYMVPRTDLKEISQSVFEGSLRHSALPKDHPAPLTFQLRFYDDNTIRFTVDEKDEVVQGVRKRYRIPANDVIREDRLKPLHGVKYVFEPRSATSTFDLGDATTLTLDHDKAILALSVDGRIVQTINGQQQLVVEGTRRQRNDKCPYGLADLSDSYIDPACSPGNHSGLWEESFHSHTDHKPFGPSLVGVDVTFHGKVPAAYGLPEHATTAQKLKAGGDEDDALYRFYNLDVFEYEMDSHAAIYGSIPILTALQRFGGKSSDIATTTTTSSSSVLWLNPSDTFVSLTQRKDTGTWSSLIEGLISGSSTAEPTSLTSWFVSESGIIDLFLFPQRTPQKILNAYHSLTGLAPLPPLFSLGKHQCRWNYKDESEVRELVANFDKYNIPVDVVWLDIEHTDHKKYHTWNEKYFPDPKQMLEDLKAGGREMVTIVDPHIKQDTTYFVYSEGLAQDVFVKKRPDEVYSGHCWPGTSVYPDFTNSSVRQWWASYFKADGVNAGFYTWNDMNEPSVFNGPEVSMDRDLIHGGDIEHRDVHNIYGQYFHRATFEGHAKHRRPGQRPFVLTRSFYVGSHMYGPMWTGDNEASWLHLKAVLPMLVTLSATAGYSFVGADVGGFFGHPEEELFTRWHQLSAATNPFYRSHAHIESPRREPWEYSEAARNRVKEAVQRRYQMLPFWYTLFARYSLYGEAILRPLWFDHLHDANTYACPVDGCDEILDSQVVLGRDVMVRGVVESGTNNVSVYLPEGARWYNAKDEMMPVGMNENMAVTMDTIPHFYRAGSIIPLKMRQRPSTKAMRGDPITLEVFVDPNTNTAEGQMYLDDGNSLDSIDRADYTLSTIKFDGQSISSTEVSGKGDFSILVERIDIIGLSKAVRERILNNPSISAKMSSASGNRVTIKRPNGVVMGKPWSIDLTSIQTH